MAWVDTTGLGVKAKPRRNAQNSYTYIRSHLAQAFWTQAIGIMRFCSSLCLKTQVPGVRYETSQPSAHRN